MTVSLFAILEIEKEASQKIRHRFLVLVCQILLVGLNPMPYLMLVILVRSDQVPQPFACFSFRYAAKILRESDPSDRSNDNLTFPPFSTHQLYPNFVLYKSLIVFAFCNFVGSLSRIFAGILPLYPIFGQT